MKQELRDALLNLLLPLFLILGLVLLLSLNTRQNNQPTAVVSLLEEWLKVIVGYLVVGVEIAVAVVIGGMIVRGFLSYVRQLFSLRQHVDAMEVICLQLGRVTALGLEFTVASDILRTAVAHTHQDILNLGVIVLLRTLLNYFLERKIRQGQQSRLLEYRV